MTILRCKIRQEQECWTVLRGLCGVLGAGTNPEIIKFQFVFPTGISPPGQCQLPLAMGCHQKVACGYAFPTGVVIERRVP